MANIYRKDQIPEHLQQYFRPAEIGLEDTPDAYIRRLIEVFREVQRVLHPTGTLWVNIGDGYANDTKWGGTTGGEHVAGLHGEPVGRSRRNTGLKGKDLIGIPWLLAFALRADGWWLRSEIVWAKTAPMPESVTDRPTSAHEKVFLFAKQARYYYDAEAVREPSVSPEQERHNRRYAKVYDAADANAANKQPGNVNSKGIHARPGPGGRNMRNVWTLGPDPFPGAHFATFPREIPRRAILAGTSERGVCAECGAPWERVVERTGEIVDYKSSRFDAGKTSAAGLGRVQASERRAKRAVDWRPTCSCDAPTVPAVVLDPFAGSGRTLAVAKSLGRRGIGIDLNETYLREFAVPSCQQLAMLDLEAV